MSYKMPSEESRKHQTLEERYRSDIKELDKVSGFYFSYLPNGIHQMLKAKCNNNSDYLRKITNDIEKYKKSHKIQENEENKEYKEYIANIMQRLIKDSITYRLKINSKKNLKEIVKSVPGGILGTVISAITIPIDIMMLPLEAVANLSIALGEGEYHLYTLTEMLWWLASESIDATAGPEYVNNIKQMINYKYNRQFGKYLLDVACILQLLTSEDQNERESALHTCYYGAGFLTYLYPSTEDERQKMFEGVQCLLLDQYDPELVGRLICLLKEKGLIKTADNTTKVM